MTSIIPSESDLIPSIFSQEEIRHDRFKREAAFQGWLCGKIAELLKLDSINQIQPEDIDIQTPFFDFGLDSVKAVRLAGELESWLGIELPDYLAWEYPTIQALARYLATEINYQESTTPINIGDKEVYD